uniref:Uncharacterized protein n=1 Tax=Varanus komodoensis TaxID=61221 RepID=A0A8D2KYT9_VARKO
GTKAEATVSGEQPGSFGLSSCPSPGMETLSDLSLGCCGTFCFFCLGCKIAKDMDECCCCGPSVAMRTRYRTLYRIPASYLTIISRPFDMACHRQPRETAGHFLQKSAHVLLLLMAVSSQGRVCELCYRQDMAHG